MLFRTVGVRNLEVGSFLVTWESSLQSHFSSYYMLCYFPPGRLTTRDEEIDLEKSAETPEDGRQLNMPERW